MRWPRGVEVSPRSSRICIDDGGRGQHEAHAATKATGGAKPASDADAREQRAADAPPAATPSPKISPPQAPQPRRLHLEPDDEQEHHDAELGDVQDRLRIGEQAEAEGPDDEAGGEIAEHGAEPEPLEQRHRDDAGGEQRDNLDQFAGISFSRQVGLPDVCFHTAPQQSS